jgi:hypothetical protein
MDKRALEFAVLLGEKANSRSYDTSLEQRLRLRELIGFEPKIQRALKSISHFR